jgi:uncharacterized membrane protein
MAARIKDWLTKRRTAVLSLLVALATAEFVLVLEQTGQFHSAALLVGVPTFMAILLAVGVKPREHITGAALKWTSVGLLMAMPLFGIWAICILMASPIILSIVVFATRAIHRSRQNKSQLHGFIAIPLLLILSLEGTTELTTFDRREVVTVSKTVAASAHAIEQQLASELMFDRPLPFFLRLFPEIVGARGAGIEIGDRRVVRLVEKGSPRPIVGDVVFEVAERHGNFVRFVPIQDNTLVGRWLTWRYSEVTWQRIDAQHTRVTWTLGFERDLDPFWYFRPLERYGVRKAAEALIENVATPRN